MRKHPFTCLVFLYCLTSSTISISQVQKIYLHPKSKTIGKQSQIVDSLRFIPLEVKEGIKIGTFYNVELTDKFILVKIHSSTTLLLYSSEGRFIKEISYKHLNNLYPVYDNKKNQIVFSGNNKNYTLTSKDQVKIKLDWANPRNKKYFKNYAIDLDDPTFTIKPAPVTESDILKSYPYYDDYYWQGQITTSTLYKDSLDYEFKLYKDKKLVKGFFPYNAINEPRFLYVTNYITFTGTDTPYIKYMSRPYCDTIYKMIKESLYPQYQVVLPLENSLPAAFYTTAPKNKTERDNFNRNNGWAMQQVNEFYENPAYIYLQVRYFSNFDSYIYEKKSNITYIIKNLRTDSSQYNLRLLDGYNVMRKGDWFFKPQPASGLLSFFQQNKNIAVPKELETFLASKPPNDAPVIVAFKLKTNL
jgi:hypothetical protein